MRNRIDWKYGMKVVVKVYEKAVAEPDPLTGRYFLHYAAERGVKWVNGLQDVLDTNLSSIDESNPPTGF